MEDHLMRCVRVQDLFHRPPRGPGAMRAGYQPHPWAEPLGDRDFLQGQVHRRGRHGGFHARHRTGCLSGSSDGHYVSAATSARPAAERVRRWLMLLIRQGHRHGQHVF